MHPPPPSSLGRQWQDFWSARGDAWHTSVFRILWSPLHLTFALVVLSNTLLEGGLPALPYPGLEVFSLLPSSATLALATVYAACALLVLVGWRTRTMQVVLAVLAIPLFFRSASSYQNHYAFYLLITAYLTLASTERYYSLDARRKRALLSPQEFAKWQEESQPLLAHRLILLQAAFLYLFAGLNKLTPTWFIRWSTTAEILDLAEGRLIAPLWHTLLDLGIAWIPLAMLTGFMLFLPVGIFLIRRFPGIALLAVLMHVAFDLHFRIMQFSQMMTTILFLALYPADTAEVIILVDPSCLRCRNTRTFLRGLSGRTVRWETQGHGSSHRLLVRSEGKVHAGADVIRAILSVSPKLKWLLPILAIPGIPLILNRVGTRR